MRIRPGRGPTGERRRPARGDPAWAADRRVRLASAFGPGRRSLRCSPVNSGLLQAYERYLPVELN